MSVLYKYTVYYINVHNELTHKNKARGSWWGNIILVRKLRFKSKGPITRAERMSAGTMVPHNCPDDYYPSITYRFNYQKQGMCCQQ